MRGTTDRVALRRGLAMAAIALLTAQSGEASQITFRFTGTIAEIAPGLSESIPGGLPPVGSAFSVEYTFDPATPDDEVEPDIGRYQAISELRLFLEASAVEFVMQPGELPYGRGSILVYPGDATGHRHNATVTLGTQSGDVSPGFGDLFGLTVGVDLVDQDFSALPDDSLPSTLAPLDRFEIRALIFEVQFPDDYVGFLGHIESFTVVPEPSSGMLLAAGLLTLRRRTRRDFRAGRRRRAS